MNEVSFWDRFRTAWLILSGHWLCVMNHRDVGLVVRPRQMHFAIVSEKVAGGTRIHVAFTIPEEK